MRVSWPLGLASGFHPLISGRENVKFVARAYGEDVYKVLMFVEDFSELARLAFGLSMEPLAKPHF